ncbi:MAG: dihydroorotate dehydrogenase-like protein [Candidatus Glassbacteria bacterium]|nr:dihydroorotate dehydrogenase-like protein [Candidatus Glassbacteria bacterium]
MPELSVEYLGLKLRNPLIVASSGLTRNASLVRQCEEAGAGAVVMKSIFEEDIRRKDNTFDDFFSTHPEASEYFRADVGLVYGAQQYCEEIKKAKKETGIPVIASVNCAESRWWVDYAAQLEGAGADAIELNLSVPSIDLELTSEQAEDSFRQIVTAVASKVKIPVAVKMSGQLTTPQSTAKKLVDAGADALVVFNRQSGLDISLNSRKAFSSKGEQGLTSGHQLYYPLRWITILHELMPKVQLSASGGVHSGDALVKYILAGARTVQVCSLFYRDGLKQAAHLLDSLSAYMKLRKVDTVDQLAGSVERDIMIGTREQQRMEYLLLSKGHYLEVDSTDGGGLMYESYSSHEDS